MPYRLLAPDDPALQALQEALFHTPQRDISLDIVPWAEYRDRLMFTLQADRATYHAVCVPGHVWLPELAAAGLLLPLDAPLAADPEALSTYQPDDLLPLVAQESRYQGVLYQFPLFSDGHILFYRADLVDLPAMPVPTVSTTPLADLAARVHNPPDLYGLAPKARSSTATNAAALRVDLDTAADVLRKSRPTAVNLFGAINRVMARAADPALDTPDAIRAAVLAEAHAIAQEDVQINKQIGLHALSLVPDPATVVHHCNTGSLATVDYGTALGIIRTAHEHGRRIQVLVDETRPRLQGARLTSWELKMQGIPHP